MLPAVLSMKKNAFDHKRGEGVGHPLNWQRSGFDVVYEKNQFKRVTYSLPLGVSHTKMNGNSDDYSRFLRLMAGAATVCHFRIVLSLSKTRCTSRWDSRTLTRICSDISTRSKRITPRLPLQCMDGVVAFVNSDLPPVRLSQLSEEGDTVYEHCRAWCAASYDW